MKNIKYLIPLTLPFLISNAFAQALPNYNNSAKILEFKPNKLPLTISNTIKEKAQQMGTTASDVKLTNTTNWINKVGYSGLTGAGVGIAYTCATGSCTANSVANAGISWGVSSAGYSYCMASSSGGPWIGALCFAGSTALGYLSSKLYNLGYNMAMGNGKLFATPPATGTSANPPTVTPSTNGFVSGTPTTIYLTTLQVSQSQLMPLNTAPVGISCSSFQTCVDLQKLNYVTLYNAQGYSLTETTSTYNQKLPSDVNLNDVSYYYYLYFKPTGNGAGIGDISSPSISAVIGTPTITCTSGLVIDNQCVALAYAKTKATINSSTGTGVSTPVEITDMGTLTNAISPENLNTKADPAFVADLTNALWQQASQQPGYDGLPYPSTNPVNAPDVLTASSAQPGGMPAVGDVLAPASSPSELALPDPVSGRVVDPNTGKATDPNTGQVTNPNTGGSTTTVTDANGNTITVNTNVSVDWGANNGVQGNLEATYEMPQILDPIFSLVKPWTDFKVATHSSSCPSYTFNIFNQDYDVNAVCNLIEPHKDTIGALFLLLFTIGAMFIILGA